MVDILDVYFNTFCKNLHDQYVLHADPKPLANAIREGNKELKGKKIQGFIADIIEGKVAINKRKSISFKKVERDYQIIMRVEAYSIGAKIPINGNSITDGACAFIKDEFEISENHALKIWSNRMNNYQYESLANIMYPRSSHTWGRMVYIKKDGVPSTYCEYKAIGNEINKMSEDEWKNLQDVALNEISKEYEERREKERAIRHQQYAIENNISLEEVCDHYWHKQNKTN